MTEIDWPDYVGVVSGVIGMITGSFGAIIGYKSYKKSNEIKALDLRLELRKKISDFEAAYHHLENLLPEANRAMLANLSARNMLNSSFKDKWDLEYENDMNDLDLISESMPDSDLDYTNYSTGKLETELVNIHQLLNSVEDLKRKYVSCINEIKSDVILRRSQTRNPER